MRPGTASTSLAAAAWIVLAVFFTPFAHAADSASDESYDDSDEDPDVAYGDHIESLYDPRTAPRTPQGVITAGDVVRPDPLDQCTFAILLTPDLLTDPYEPGHVVPIPLGPCAGFFFDLLLFPRGTGDPDAPHKPATVFLELHEPDTLPRDFEVVGYPAIFVPVSVSLPKTVKNITVMADEPVSFPASTVGFGAELDNLESLFSNYATREHEVHVEVFLEIISSFGYSHCAAVTKPRVDRVMPSAGLLGSVVDVMGTFRLFQDSWAHCVFHKFWLRDGAGYAKVLGAQRAAKLSKRTVRCVVPSELPAKPSDELMITVFLSRWSLPFYENATWTSDSNKRECFSCDTSDQSANGFCNGEGYAPFLVLDPESDAVDLIRQGAEKRHRTAQAEHVRIHATAGDESELQGTEPQKVLKVQMGPSGDILTSHYSDKR